MNRAQLTDALHKAGIRRAHKLIVHSSFKSIKFEGTPEDACRAFMEAITEDGILMMVTHTYCFRCKPNAERVYDRTKTRSEVGAMSDAFFRIHGVERSFHPTHSVAAWGKGAWDYLKEDYKGDTMGKTSPLYKLCADGGDIMMMGCLLSSCAAFHVAEFLAGVPYLKRHYDPSWGFDADYLDPDGTVKTYHFETVPGCSHDFNKAGPELLKQNAMKAVSLNSEKSMLLYGNKSLQVVVDLLKKDPLFFKDKDNRNCPQCTQVFGLENEKVH